MKLLFELTKIAIGVLAGAALVFLLNINLHLFQGDSSSVEMSYADLATINLTVATVVLGGVALIVGIVAVFGFQVIRTESVSNAKSHVKEELPAMLERELSRMENDGRLTRAVERAIYSGGTDDDGSRTATE